MNPELKKYKYCSHQLSEKCIISGPPDMFYRSRCCKPCNSAKTLKYYHDHKEAILPKVRKADNIKYHKKHPTAKYYGQPKAIIPTVQEPEEDEIIDTEDTTDEQLVETMKRFLTLIKDNDLFKDLKEALPRDINLEQVTTVNLEQVVTPDNNPEVQDSPTINKLNA